MSVIQHPTPEFQSRLGHLIVSLVALVLPLCLAALALSVLDRETGIRVAGYLAAAWLYIGYRDSLRELGDRLHGWLNSSGTGTGEPQVASVAPLSRTWMGVTVSVAVFLAYGVTITITAGGLMQRPPRASFQTAPADHRGFERPGDKRTPISNESRQ